MDLKERLLQLVEKEGLNPNQFYIKSGLANGFLNTIGSSLRKPSIEKIEKAFPHWSIEYLLTGEGDMLNSTSKPKQEAVFIENPNIIMVPLVSQYAYAGYLSGFSDMEYIETLPKIPIVADHNLKGEYLNFEVRGDSMEDGTQDSIVEGDILVCRIVRPEYWMSKLHINKWDFVIVHKTEGILIKRITEHNPETGDITIHSLNPFYKDTVLNLADISQVFNVVQVLRSRKR